MNEFFRKVATKISFIVGTPWALIIALLLISVWFLTGPIFNFSDTWQLVINTTTTIITFLMVFLIQNTQNRDSKAIHLKLDELLKSIKQARNELVDIEELPDEVLEELQQEFRNLQNKYRERSGQGSEQKSGKISSVLSQISKIVEKPLSESK